MKVVELDQLKFIPQSRISLFRDQYFLKSHYHFSGETEDGEIDLERAHPDPFSRSMALWDLKQYGAALDTLLSPAGRLHAARDSEPMPSVFNFYVYLRTHPRLKRNNLPSQVCISMMNPPTPTIIL